MRNLAPEERQAMRENGGICQSNNDGILSKGKCQSAERNRTCSAGLIGSDNLDKGKSGNRIEADTGLQGSNGIMHHPISQLFFV